MKLTRSDDFAIRTTVKHVAARERELITDLELVNALFHNFYWCETELGVQQCVAVTPSRLWPEIDLKIIAVLGTPHPGELFVFHPNTPTEKELKQLDGRVREVMAAVTKFLANPTGIVEYEVDDPDSLQQQWGLFKHFATVAGERCRKADCPEHRIHNGVFCRVHHYEMVYGELPTDATGQPDGPMSR